MTILEQPTTRQSAAPVARTSAAPAPRASALPSASPRPHRTPARWWRDLTASIGWALVLGVTALWVSDGGVGDLASMVGALNSLGRLFGLLASALLLIQVFLMARVPIIEKSWGQDALTRVHRLVGFTSFNLLLGHLVLITLGYAANTSAGVWATIVDFVVNYPGMLLAVAGTLALVMVVVTSVKAARARLRYESWHLIHLYGYLGAGLALPHQLWTGTDFLGKPVATIFWWTAYVVCAGAVLVFRLGLPIWRSLAAPIRVRSVRRDGPGVSTVTMSGRGVRRISARGGQFFNWRFLDGPGWSAANPYSLSAAPDGRTLRITAAHVGDGSARLARLRPGTRVLVEGPYGRLHAGTLNRDKVLLMASGIGITPLRAILEELPVAPGRIAIIHRVRSRAEAVLAAEISELAAARGASYVLVEGARIPGRNSWLPAQAAHLSDAQGLLQLVPDVTERDVLLCGSEGWMDAAEAALREAKVPAEQIHAERFTY